MYKAAASMTAAFCLIENQYKMFIANTGLMARRFAENSLNQHGTLTSPLRRPPENSILRERAEKSIVKIAKGWVKKFTKYFLNPLTSLVPTCKRMEKRLTAM
jgi:hypothetical protein